MHDGKGFQPPPHPPCTTRRRVETTRRRVETTIGWVDMTRWQVETTRWQVEVTRRQVGTTRWQVETTRWKFCPRFDAIGTAYQKQCLQAPPRPTRFARGFTLSIAECFFPPSLGACSQAIKSQSPCPHCAGEIWKRKEHQSFQISDYLVEKLRFDNVFRPH